MEAKRKDLRAQITFHAPLRLTRCARDNGKEMFYVGSRIQFVQSLVMGVIYIIDVDDRTISKDTPIILAG